jgi:hypothetical protein
MSENLKHLTIGASSVLRSSRRLGVALFAAAGFASMGAVHRSAPAEHAAMPVRFAEGTVHDFLELRTATGAFLANGELIQTASDSGVESRMVFHFSGSVFEETVRFTQLGVFAMQEFHLIQSGPAFEADLEVTLAQSGAYTVRSRPHESGVERQLAGTLDLPPDVYNGMAITIAKNLPVGTAESVHLVAFMPEPRIIRIELAPSGSEIGVLDRRETTVSHIVLKPRLGALIGFVARLKGQMPPNGNLWIATDSVPAFVRYQGPMYDGPIWKLSHVTAGAP